MMKIENNTTSESAIADYITKQNEIIAEAMKDSYAGAYEEKEVYLRSKGRSYAGIFHRRGGVHSFVALKDINTKSVQCSEGDILKPATYAAPANHARGSIYEPESYADYQWTGPHYLK